MVNGKVLTKKAWNIIDKRLSGRKMTQQDSNYLSRFVRPKLKEMDEIDPRELLRKLEYNPRGKALENKIKRIVLERAKSVDSIVLCGSAVQTNYKEYRDIDI